jgi:hypothetical protein
VAAPATHGRWRFLRCGIRAVAGDGEDGKGEHHERDVAVPAVPGARLVVVEAQFGLRRLEGILDGPAMSLDGDEGLDRGARRAPGGEVGEFAVGDMAPDQQATRPDPLEAADVVVRLEVGEFEISPVVQARPLGALSGRETAPGGGGQRFRVLEHFLVTRTHSLSWQDSFGTRRG